MFVFGLPRSGTSLIEQILASHPDVHGAGELRIAGESFKAIPAALGRTGPPLACADELGADAIRRLAERHLAVLDRLDGGRAARVVDKMPHNYTILGLLAALFPDATFIHCRRDLRDVAVSCWMTSFVQLDWTNDPRHIAARIAQYRRLVDHWRTVLPVAVHDVHYEHVVADLEGAAPTAGGLWAGLAPGVSGVPSHTPAGPHRERRAGAPAGLHAVGGPMAPL